jgi:hypothetical protein
MIPGKMRGSAAAAMLASVYPPQGRRGRPQRPRLAITQSRSAHCQAAASACKCPATGPRRRSKQSGKVGTARPCRSKVPLYPEALLRLPALTRARWSWIRWRCHGRRLDWRRAISGVRDAQKGNPGICLQTLFPARVIAVPDIPDDAPCIGVGRLGRARRHLTQ